MKPQWKRRRLRLLVKAKGVIGYDRRRKAERRMQRRSHSVDYHSRKTVHELFEELRQKEQRADNRLGR